MQAIDNVSLSVPEMQRANSDMISGIRKAVLEGDVDKALKYTNAFYPSVLKDNEHVSFRLKCRKYD